MAAKRNSYQLNRWMQDLPIDVQTSPIIYMAIPGSHNTFSYSLSKNSDVSPDAPKVVRTLSRLAKFIVNPIIYKWSRTQTYNVLDQLNHGVRYLDIRVVNHKAVVFACHGLFGGPLYPYLEQVLLFLDTNQGEVVILDFQHFYDFTNDDHNNLIATLNHIFGQKLCHVTDIKKLNIRHLIETSKQVIVIYRNYNVMSYPYLWPPSALPTPWPNKLKVSELEAFLNFTLANRNNDVGIVSQFLLTVDTNYIIKHPCLNLKTMASKTNSKMASWLQTHNPGASGFNIIICDFVEDNNFIKCIVEMNFKQNCTK